MILDVINHNFKVLKSIGLIDGVFFFMQSVAYTAVPVFSIAAIWFIGFGFCLLVLIVCYVCLKNEPYGYSPTCYTLSLILLILFTITTLYEHISFSSFVLLISDLV